MTTTPDTPNDPTEDPALNEVEAPQDDDTTTDGLPQPDEPDDDVATGLSEA